MSSVKVRVRSREVTYSYQLLNSLSKTLDLLLHLDCLVLLTSLQFVPLQQLVLQIPHHSLRAALYLLSLLTVSGLNVKLCCFLVQLLLKVTGCTRTVCLCCCLKIGNAKAKLSDLLLQGCLKNRQYDGMSTAYPE